MVTDADDITDQDDIDRIVAAAESKIDGLANVAGVNDDVTPVKESDAMWNPRPRDQPTGAFKLTRALLPIMPAEIKVQLKVTSEAVCVASLRQRVHRVEACCHRPHPQRGFHVRVARNPCKCRRTRRRRDRYPHAGNPIGIRQQSPCRVPESHSACRDRRAGGCVGITFLFSDGVNINGAILPADGGWSIQ